MTLRTKLVFALMLAALLPMLVAVAVSVLRAESRAQAQAARRLDAARRQASVLIQRFGKETGSRVERAASDFANDHAAFDSLLGASRPAAQNITRRLAEVHGLDRLEIVDSTGIVLSTSSSDSAVGAPSVLADSPDSGTHVRELPVAPGDRAPRLVFAARRSAVRGEETLFIVGDRVIDEDFLTEIAEVSGERTSLIEPGGKSVLTAHPAVEGDGHGGAAGPQQDAPHPAGHQQAVRQEAGPQSLKPQSSGAPARDTISGDVPLGDAGWRVRVAVPAGDVQETRRELLTIFAGIAPFALASALVIGVILAEGFSRPIRALASRAEEISAENREPFSLPPEGNEVRRLTVSFDQMLDALSDSARRRIAAERIAAWEEVARRIAHEVKNPLSPIKLAVENLRRTRVKAPEEFDRALEEETSTILEEVESLRRLVDQFSQFARLPRPRPVRCDPREIVSQALALFAPRLEADKVRVACDFDTGTPRSVNVDPEQIGRVLKNVLANALDAMAPVEDRRLHLAVRADPVRDTLMGGPGPMADSFVEIEVRDSGVGFGPGMEGRIFEPYFTTRADSGGTGLGMAIAYRIVTDHGGTIRARGMPGRGATITIRLPVARVP